jgi:hypothetical protein
MAVSDPAHGFLEKVTVKDVAVAAVTAPIAPLLKTTVFSAGVVLKPLPVIVTVFALAKTSVVVCVTVGRTDATWTAAPLENEFTETDAVKAPAPGLVEKVTVKAVAVAAVTVPTAPLLNVTVLLLGVVLNPKPLMVIVVADINRFAVEDVTVGPTAAT